MEFEWDFAKEVANIAKHGCTFAEAVDTFRDPRGIMLVDSSHAKAEERFYWVGKSLSGSVLTVRFTMRGNKIRIFGCAEWRKFRRIYDEAAEND